jgi:hypothetical protein
MLVPEGSSSLSAAAAAELFRSAERQHNCQPEVQTMLKLLCGLLTAGLFLAWASLALADDTAKAIVEKAIKAHGGAEKLAKLNVRQEKKEIKYSETSTYTMDCLIHLPQRVKSTTRGPSNYMVIKVINGDKIWSESSGKPGEETAESLKHGKELLHEDYVVTLTPLLKDKRFKLSPLAEIKVNDRPALGVKVAAKDHADVDLYFDKDTGLLVKSEATRPFDGKDIVMSTVYSEHKEADGLKWPRKRVDYWDEKQTRETEITELKFLDKIDDSEFAKPKP